MYNKKLWIVTAFILLVAGAAILVFSMTMIGWDFGKLSTVKYETNEYEITDNFDSVSVKSDTEDIIFALSKDGKCRVICYEEEKDKHTVTVKDGVLAVEGQGGKKWYEHIGINFDTPKMTFYLPAEEYSSLIINGSTGDIEISKELRFENSDITVSTGDVRNYASVSGELRLHSSTGDIFTENISVGELSITVSTGAVTVENVKCAGNINLTVSTGEAKLSGIECKKMFSDGSTGDISMVNVIATEKISIERSTGDVDIDSCDAGEIFIKTDTGDVKGTLNSEKVFIVDTNTGDKDVPQTANGGKCEITTDTGDVRIKIKQ